jgi:hypothetical protein
MKNKKISQNSLKQLTLKEEKLKYRENQIEWEKIKFEEKRNKFKKEKSNPNHYKDFNELIHKACLDEPKEQKT